MSSEFSAAVCLQKLAEQIDVDQRTLFSLSGYRGEKPILGRIQGNEFRLHKRRYWHNSVGPVLFGRAVAGGRETRIEAYWDTWRGPRVFMRIWLGFAVIIGTPLFFVSLRDLIRQKSLAQNNTWLGLVVPLVFVLWGVLFPRIGAALSAHEKAPLLQMLEQALSAHHVQPSADGRNWKSSLDSWLG